MSSMKKYIQYILYKYKLSIMQFMEYPTSVIPLMLSWFISDVVEFYMINIIVNQFQSFPGWSKEEVFFLYGFTLLSDAIANLFFSSQYGLSSHIIKGSFDTYMVRPLPVFIQFLFDRINMEVIADLTAALFFVVYARLHSSSQSGIGFWSLMLVFLVCAVLLRTGIFILVNSVSFWTKKAGSMHSTCCFLTKNITKYPISILPKVLQIIFTFVFPVAFIAYYPAANLFEKSLGRLQNICCIAGVSIGVFGLSVLLFNVGIKKYESTGS